MKLSFTKDNEANIKEFMEKLFQTSSKTETIPSEMTGNTEMGFIKKIEREVN